MRSSSDSSAGATRLSSLFKLVAGLCVLAVAGYFSWRNMQSDTDPGTSVVPGQAVGQANGPAPGTTTDRSVPVNSFPVDANRGGIPNSAGLPVGQTAPPATRRLPVKAGSNDIVGYRTDSNGVSQPLRASELKGMVPNSPGTFVVVDMWADGGYAVVPAPPRSLQKSEAQLARDREFERAEAEANRASN